MKTFLNLVFVCLACLFVSSTVAQTRRTGPKSPIFPAPGEDFMITDINSANNLYPLGLAPVEQRSCKVVFFEHKQFWDQNPMSVRIRYRFFLNVTRTDLSADKAQKGMAAAFFDPIHPVYGYGRTCHGHVQNFQAYQRLPLQVPTEWFVDFDTWQDGNRPFAHCKAMQFSVNWGIWTGCRYAHDPANDDALPNDNQATDPSAADNKAEDIRNAAAQAQATKVGVPSPPR